MGVENNTKLCDGAGESRTGVKRLLFLSWENQAE
jgi:hypothetical protein